MTGNADERRGILGRLRSARPSTIAEARSRHTYLETALRDVRAAVETLEDLVLRLNTDAWEAAQLRHEDVLAQTGELNADAWKAAQLRHEDVLGRVAEMREDLSARVDRMREDVLAQTGELNADSWKAAQLRHEDVLGRVAEMREDLSARVDRMREDVLAHIDGLAQRVAENHATSWDSDRALASTTLQRFAGLERAVRSVISPARGDDGPARFAISDPRSELWRELAARGHEVPTRHPAGDAPSGEAVECGSFILEFPTDDTVMLPYIREHGTWEPHIGAALEAHVQPGDIAIDLGAHVGVFTCVLARAVGPTGTVIAVEPDPVNAALLHRNLRANGFGEILVVEAAIAATEGAAMLYRSPSGNTGDSRTIEWDESGDVSPVAALPLDALVPESLEVALIKIDVQGSDSVVLRSSRRVIEDHHPTVVLELTPGLLREQDERPEEMLEWLEGLGYVLAALGDDGGEERSPAALVEIADGRTTGYVDVLCVHRSPT